MLAGRAPRVVSAEDRARFLLDYIDLLLDDGSRELEGFRHHAPATPVELDPRAKSRERWVVNKVRALCTWYTKGLDGGSHLRIAINAAPSIAEVRDIVDRFFLAPETFAARGRVTDDSTDDAALLAGH
jgi:tRNA-dihydrouridine synthase